MRKKELERKRERIALAFDVVRRFFLEDMAGLVLTVYLKDGTALREHTGNKGGEKSQELASEPDRRFDDESL